VRGLTVNEIAARLRVPQSRVRELMTEDAERGVVEQDLRGRWHLTGSAERRFGETLRNITAPVTRPRRRRAGPYAASEPQGNLDDLDGPASDGPPPPLRFRGASVRDRRGLGPRPTTRRRSTRSR
jgi:hypothetical protein